MIWISNKSGNFNVKDYFATLTSHSTSNVANGIWKDLWSAKLHERIKVFLWKILAGVLPTKQHLAHLFCKGDSLCCLCGLEEETELHIFVECLVTRQIAFGSFWGCASSRLSVNSVTVLLSYTLNPSRGVSGFGQEDTIMTIVLANLFYCVWNFINECLYLGKKDSSYFIHLLNFSVTDFIRVLDSASQ